MTAPRPSTMRRDIASAYLAAGTKIGSWVLISAMVYRWYGAAAFAMVALVRATLSILNYTTFGLSPAMIHLLAQAEQPTPVLPLETPTADTSSLSYAGAVIDTGDHEPIHLIYTNGIFVGVLVTLVGVGILEWYAENFFRLHRLPANVAVHVPCLQVLVSGLGLGMVLRLFSDVPGAAIQTRGRIALDNTILAVGDALWVAFAVLMLEPNGAWCDIRFVGSSFLFSNALLALGRFITASYLIGLPFISAPIVPRLMRSLLVFGGSLALAQLADYLYAPIDFVLINRLLDPVLTAVYSPAVQIDAGLLLLVGGVASVLLPKTALAHASGNVALIRKYFVRGTLFTGGLLAIAGVVIWLLSPWIFRLWLHDPMTPTQVILPLVLIHTVVGGSSAVGRSILLGMGKVKPFTIAVLTAGVSNVILSYCFVRYGGLGLKGIILGTIVVVVARCAIWQPWYVLRCLRAGEGTLGAGV